MSSKVWLLLLLRIFGDKASFLTVNLISSAPLIFCTTKHIMDPQGVNLHSDSENNASQLDILQGVRQNIFKHHKRFTDKTLNHIVYIDKKLWDSPDDAFKQKILSDAEKNKNKVIVVYDSATGEKNVIRQPRNSQSLEFETVR
jgi:hypothetical protein